MVDSSWRTSPRQPSCAQNWDVKASGTRTTSARSWRRTYRRTRRTGPARPCRTPTPRAPTSPRSPTANTSLRPPRPPRTKVRRCATNAVARSLAMRRSSPSRRDDRNIATSTCLCQWGPRSYLARSAAAARVPKPDGRALNHSRRVGECRSPSTRRCLLSLLQLRRHRISDRA